MFVWLASYPKSGNTLVRSLLSSYFFSRDGKFDFNLIKNIKQFPKKSLFLKNGIDTKNDKEVIKNYLKVQETINLKNSIQFLKTHSYLFNIENHPFTNLEYSLGAIYIVRDPRNVVLSSSNHNSQTHEKSTEDLIKGRELYDKEKEDIKVYAGTWAGNYNSWKSFKSANKYLLVKYEDLIKDTEKTFLNILKFIAHLGRVKFTLDEIKFKNALKTTELKKLNENDTKKLDQIDPKIKNKLEKELENEMRELNYLENKF